MSSLCVRVPAAAECDGDCPAVHSNSLLGNNTESGEKICLGGSHIRYKIYCRLLKYSKIVMEEMVQEAEGDSAMSAKSVLEPENGISV